METKLRCSLPSQEDETASGWLSSKRMVTRMNGIKESHVLRLDRICKSFGGLRVLTDVDLLLARDEIVGLIGPNGAGKSTLFNVITSIYKPDRGDVYLREHRITGLAPHKICHMGIART